MSFIILLLLVVLTIIHFLIFVFGGLKLGDFPPESLFSIKLIKILILSIFTSLYMILCFSPFSYFCIFISFIVITIFCTNFVVLWVEEVFCISYLLLISVCFLIFSIAFTYVAYSKDNLLPITFLFTDFKESMLLWEEFLSQ